MDRVCRSRWDAVKVQVEEVGTGRLNNGEGAEELVIQSLSHKSPLVRGLALFAVSTFNIRSNEVKALIRDRERFKVYEDRELVEKTVGDAAQRVLDQRGCT